MECFCLCVYRHLSWDTVGYTFTVKSTQQNHSRVSLTKLQFIFWKAVATFSHEKTVFHVKIHVFRYGQVKSVISVMYIPDIFEISSRL